MRRRIARTIGRPMPEVVFTGPAGRLEGRFHQSATRGAPIALILHPHPQFGGTMNNQIVYNLYYAFAERGFSVLRFNFRGVGRSEGCFDYGVGELADAAAALDWAQAVDPNARACWIAGVSFGSWIAMKLLMRRLEIEGFVAIAAPANRFDFSFLAPRPRSGQFIHGDLDRVACDDGNGNAVYSKRIPFTDFPLEEMAFYFTNKTILLPSEY